MCVCACVPVSVCAHAHTCSCAHECKLTCLVVLLRVGWGLTRRIPLARSRLVFSCTLSRGVREGGPGGLRGSQWITTKATLLPGVWGGRFGAPGTWHLALVFRLLSSGRPLRPGIAPGSEEHLWLVLSRCSHGLPSSQGRCSCPRDWATGCFYDVFIFTCVSCHFFKANRTIVSQYNCLSVFFISLFVK